MLRFVLFLFGFLFNAALWSQSPIERNAYLANQAGDSLFLHNIIQKDTITFIFLADQKDSTRLQKIQPGLGSWTIRTLPGGEQYLESLQLVGGWQYRFHQPLPMLPFEFNNWHSFSNQTEFTAFKSGVRRGKGVFTLGYNVQNKDSARTPLRNFGDCIVLLTNAKCTGSGFPVLEYNFKEWYAKDIGLVKLAGSYTLRDVKPQTIKIASNLVKAQIAGAPLAGRN